MNSIQSLFQQTNPYEQFVQQLVALESQQKLRFEAQQDTQRERKTALGDVSSSISKFTSKITELENPANKALKPLSASSSDESVVRVNSAAGIDNPSNYNITVERLATNDTALSQIMQGDGYDLAAEGNGSVDITIGDQTETINVETTKVDENGNTVDKTNAEILESFAGEISELLGDQARASVFQVNNDEVQFSIQSLETGVDHQIQFGNESGVLAEVTNNMNKLVPGNELDAEFIIDGVTFERSQNVVDDAVNGLSFTLLKDTGEQEQISVQRDIEGARENVDGFIEAFNSMNKTIRDHTFIDAEADRQGTLQNMRSIRNLTLNLRQTALLPMDGAGAEELSRLSDIGIGFENDGTMVIEDSDLLNEVLEQRPEEVSNLFASENSPVAAMKDQAETYTKTNGIINSLEAGLDQKIDRLDSRISAEERYLERYEEQQREMFNELQRIQDEGQAQFDQVMNFRQQMGM